MSDPWEEVDRAEARLDDRARERERKRRRRERWAAIVRWSGIVALPAIGAAVFTAVIEAAGGDLGAWSDAEAVAVVLAAMICPALLAGWLWRRRGVLEAVAAAFVVFCAQLGLTFRIAFALLGYGPV